MKSSSILKAVNKDCLSRSYVVDGDNVYPPNHPKAIAIIEARSKRQPRTTHVKTGWIDDTRNIKNKQARPERYVYHVDRKGAAGESMVRVFFLY